MARMARRSRTNECRPCATFCDRVIHPASCVAAGCALLYEYDDPLSGRRYMGCLQKVFASEIDVELFARAERTLAGFGAVKLSGTPLRRCQFGIEQAFGTVEGEERACVNRRFLDLPETAPDGLRAFDLRDRL